MPVIEYFPYRGPNRRMDTQVVEILLKFGPADDSGFPRQVSEISELLISGGILTPDEVFPEQALPDERMAWYTSLLVQTALLFQRKTGHRVNFFSFSVMPEQKRSLALLEHEHCDVGMTAVKLACELLTGERRLLAEPFRMFSKFAGDRLLPLETEAIIKAAERRGIPFTQLERDPFKRTDFEELTGGRCIQPNGLLMLGHGEHQRVLDGVFCIDLKKDFSALFDTVKQQAVKRGLAESAALNSAADTLLDTLFPLQKPSQMPIIAITGTNGKTTTTRMVSQIMSATGRKPGMVCTDGIYLNGQMIQKGDSSANSGHAKVLISKAVNFAVLETHHRGILQGGFAFHWCDIAVCLNVTEDHLGLGNIDTVEQMAEVKRALPERARHAVVLNADNSHTLAMLEQMTAQQKCLVSMQSSRDQLFARHGEVLTCCCVLEDVDEREFMVIYDHDRRLPVMAVDDIPASYAGVARFMVSNAMHAAVASYLAGVGIDVIRQALRGFEANYATTPGRLNIFDDLPFRVIMDFAHNPDGMRHICEFIDRQKPTGRKLIAFAATVNRSDETIRHMGHSIAGHFDFYFCKEHLRADGTQPRLVARILQQGLMDKGVAESQTAIMTHGRDEIFRIFDACRPGDLLTMLMGLVEKNQLPDYIREYADLLKQRQSDRM